MPKQELFLIGTMKNQIPSSKLRSKRHCLSVSFYIIGFVKLNLNEISLLAINVWFFGKVRIILRIIYCSIFFRLCL